MSAWRSAQAAVGVAGKARARPLEDAFGLRRGVPCIKSAGEGGSHTEPPFLRPETLDVSAGLPSIETLAFK